MLVMVHIDTAPGEVMPGSNILNSVQKGIRLFGGKLEWENVPRPFKSFFYKLLRHPKEHTVSTIRNKGRRGGGLTASTSSLSGRVGD